MDISRVIQDLLVKNGHVSVHGLGSFDLINMPAEMFKYKNEMAPPTVQLLFNENYTITDNSLINTLIAEYDLTFDEVRTKTEEWVKEIKSTLDNGSQYYINEIGTLKKLDGKITFDPDKVSPLFAENFGLEVTSLPLIELEGEVVKEETQTIIEPVKEEIKQPEAEKKEEPKQPEKPVIIAPKPIISEPAYVPPAKKSSKWKKLGWAAAIILVVLIGLYFLVDSGIFVEKKYRLATNDTLAGKIDAEELKRKALEYKESQNASEKTKVDTLKSKSLKYYLIAGSFKTMQNAEKYKDELIKKGYTPEILSLDDSIYRVSLASFTDRHKAVEEYITLNAGEYNNKLWLFSQAVSE
jgi:nucleoid DNA-binding protein